jgi:hypothetical protein
MHLLIWLKRRQAWASLWFFVSATGTCLLALDELWMMRSQTIPQYTSAIRWLGELMLPIVLAHDRAVLAPRVTDGKFANVTPNSLSKPCQFCQLSRILSQRSLTRNSAHWFLGFRNKRGPA